MNNVIPLILAALMAVGIRGGDLVTTSRSHWSNDISSRPVGPRVPI